MGCDPPPETLSVRTPVMSHKIPLIFRPLNVILPKDSTFITRSCLKPPKNKAKLYFEIYCEYPVSTNYQSQHEDAKIARIWVMSN